MTTLFDLLYNDPAVHYYVADINQEYSYDLDDKFQDYVYFEYKDRIAQYGALRNHIHVTVLELIDIIEMVITYETSQTHTTYPNPRDDYNSRIIMGTEELTNQARVFLESKDWEVTKGFTHKNHVIRVKPRNYDSSINNSNRR